MDSFYREHETRRIEHVNNSNPVATGATLIVRSYRARSKRKSRTRIVENSKIVTRYCNMKKEGRLVLDLIR